MKDVPAGDPAEFEQIAHYLSEQFADRADAIDIAGRFPVDNLQLLRDSGLLGLLVPRSFGGAGGDLRQMAHAAETLAGGCLSTAMIWAMHCQQVATIAEFGSDELCEKLLPRIASGQVYIASVTSERGTGGQLLAGSDALVEVDTGWEISRDAPIVTGAEYADGYLVSMRADDSATAHSSTLVYVERNQLDIAGQCAWDSMGMRAMSSPGIKLKGTVQRHQVVGCPGGFGEIATTFFAPLGHLGWSACWLGAAKSAFKSVIGLYGTAAAPASFDVRSDLFVSKVGRIRVDLELAAAYLRSVLADFMDLHGESPAQLANPPAQIHLNILKVAVSELAYRVSDQLIDLVGLRLGYQRDSPLPLERTFRDLRSASLNYHNDRLLIATGRLCLLDRSVRLI